MTFPNDYPIGTEPRPSPGSTQDVVPAGERDQDAARSALTHALTAEPERPLTHDEQQAAEHDTPRGERVYAPASERVPVSAVPGHRDMVDHPDTGTPERQAAGWTEPSSTWSDDTGWAGYGAPDR